MESFVLAPEAEDAGKRIDVYVSEAMETLSRSRAKELLLSGLILLNGEGCKANYRVKPGDVVEITLPPAEEPEILPQDIPLDVLYEDGELIVVNKPKGMVVHPAPGHWQDTLVNALMYHCRDNLSGINGVLRPGIVHRIDKDTSGILMAAKTDGAHRSLALQLAEHSIKRRYYALVMNGIKEDQGTIDKPIARHPLERKKMAVSPKGRRAVTHYRVLRRLGKYTYIEASLETGRTHQIRVHMSFMGNPLLGDTVYGPKKQPVNTEGQVLHAGVLGFIHPKTGEYMEFSAPLPEYFEKLLMRLENQ